MNIYDTYLQLNYRSYQLFHMYTHLYIYNIYSITCVAHIKGSTDKEHCLSWATGLEIRNRGDNASAGRYDPPNMCECVCDNDVLIRSYADN